MLTQWRERLAERLVSPNEIPAPLPITDKWIGLSTVHKAVRRGDAALAGAAAMALLTMDRAGLWKTLLTTAFEDIGVGDENVVISCAAAAEDASWRAKVGETGVLVRLCRMMADAPKDRSSDNLITAARAHPGLEEYREMAGGSPLADRLRLVEDTTLPISARSIAAWFVSGVNWHGVQRVGPGDLEGLLETYLSIGASPELVAATRIGVRKVHEPIVLLPALISTVTRIDDTQIVINEPPPSAFINGVPAHAFDRFTRLGKQSITIFASKNAALRAALDGLVPDRRWAAVTALCVFHAEGGRLFGKRRLWRDALALEKLGIEADCLPEDIRPDDFTKLIEITTTELPDLDRIRARLVTEAGQPAHGQFL